MTKAIGAMRLRQRDFSFIVRLVRFSSNAWPASVPLPIVESGSPIWRKLENEGDAASLPKTTDAGLTFFSTPSSEELPHARISEIDTAPFLAI